MAFFRKGPSEIFLKINEMTDIYMRNDNLKRTGQLRNVRVESGFVTVCSYIGAQSEPQPAYQLCLMHININREPVTAYKC